MSDLTTNAEQHAMKATRLPAFLNVALPGLKAQVEQMLNLIGHSGEVFATYTKHDISHINAMLKYLDWLIPPTTQTVMTPVDWLLITLSIYFHDLGMLVTREEFEQRSQNKAFKEFLEKLKNDPKSQDYLGRASKMNSEQKDIFFFQEFIRENHASRIKEWITGRHSSHWGTAVKPITETIANLMNPFPGRFRENLATVCESHHRADLNKLDLYPLYQVYGNTNQEMANVQYAALILRTVDLIHVTKDRTPSIMYKTINFSDPKGVDEWDRQKETFAVRHAGRTFDSDKEETHLINISADFTEERPFFALTEYIAWADVEIKQTKRWADLSQKEPDGKDFWFPWLGINGDLRVAGNEPQRMRFTFDRGRLLDLLVGHAIYNDATVSIREILQNAIDAVRFRYHLDSRAAQVANQAVPTMGKVSIHWDPNTRELVVEDQGIGMDLDIIQNHLMRVGSSFYDTPEFATEYKGFTPISRFGIGILTCFMISDYIEIFTVKQSCGHRIRMSSVHADYLLRELPLGSQELANIEPHGTRVKLIIRDGIDLKKRTVKDIIRHWIILPECSVEYIEAGKSNEKIGFDSPTKALMSFYDESRKEKAELWKGLEITCKERNIGTGHYNMGLAVQSGWFPEKTFAPPPRAGLPAVCIEGIRVSDVLPGFAFQGTSGLSAIVSIRGIRSLRTTVSRSGLELDEEYLKLGRICVEMLAEHIREEIERISNESGRPLSRASTAGKWLSSDLASLIHVEPIRKHFWEQRKAIPLVVIEKIEMKNGASEIDRRLISPEILENQNEFWTIESRLVDSLGLISRDLGRELSLNAFLKSLAPEHVQLGHSPILLDANLFAADILELHHPDLVEFSRLYQQTAIKWIPGKRVANESANIALKDEAFHFAVNQEFRKLIESRIQPPALTESKLAIAEIRGDESKVSIVRTQMLTILAKNSNVSLNWQLIQQGLKSCSENKEPAEFVIFLRLINLFEYLVSRRGGYFVRGQIHDNEDLGDGGNLNRAWAEVVEKINAILTKYQITSKIPDSIEFIMREKFFNASDYWRDWHRTEKK